MFPFTLTVENNSAASWEAGVLVVLPELGSPNAILPLPDAPTGGDPYDTYTYAHQSCDPNGEDDGDALLLISRWPALTEGVNAFVVGPLLAGDAQVVAFSASPGEVMSFVARVTATGDDAVVAHALLDLADPTVDLFDAGGTPLSVLEWSITGLDLVDCVSTCPPIAGCVSTAGGLAGVGAGGPQLSSGGCDALDWYTDADGDGLGDPATWTAACAAPPSGVDNASDCDDADPAVGVARDWHPDLDGDGYGAALVFATACTAPPGTLVDGTDCDDGDPDNHESCATCADFDGDGWFVGCDTYVVRSGPDCDDGDPAIYPGAEEIPGDEVDEDCLDGPAPAAPVVGDDRGPVGEPVVVGEGCGCQHGRASPWALALWAGPLAWRRGRRARGGSASG